jgi:hypothetical protein
MTTTAARALLRGAFVAAVLLYGALLRFDALTQIYGPVTRPGWLQRLQYARECSSFLRPDRLWWDPAPVFPHRDGPRSASRSDPYTYLQHARATRSIYAANLREPIFPAATRLFLYVLDGPDVYRATEGHSVEVSRTARAYLTAEARARPLRTLDTVVLGMTRYPFDNKWHG